jgi:RNA polymerase sigma factor for flagellar operon FliA
VPNTRDALVQQHIGLVHHLAKRLHGSLADEADLDELISAGFGGLLAAADAFDPSRGFAFSTYAAARIRGAMLDELRRLDPLTRTERHRVRQLEQTRERLAQALHRPPDARDVARALGTSATGLLALERDLRNATPLRLDAGRDTEPTSAPEPGQWQPFIEEDLDLELDRERDRERLRQALHHLDRDALEVLVLSFFEDRPLREIAPRLGVTESGASRIRSRALAQLRRHLSTPPRVA